MAAAASGENVAPAPAPIPASVLPAGGAGGSSAPPLPAGRRIVGKGGYGAVLKPALPNYFNGAWHEYPDNVTKLFFKKKSKDEIVALTPHISAIIGPNNGHRVNTYRHSYKVKNIPSNIKAAVLSGKSPNNNLFPVRMPDLGVDLSITNLAKNYKEIRNRPVGVILAQTLKLLQQVKNIKDHGYIHGDIRAVNVMIRPDTGVMTLIDFDWLKPLNKFKTSYPFGFYCHPPETLEFYSTLNYGKSAIIVSNKREYTRQILNQFRFLLPMLGYPTTEALLLYYLSQVEAENVRPVKVNELTEDDLIQTFDSYGMAWVLLSLYSQIYPNSVLNAANRSADHTSSFKSGLSTRLSAGTNIDAAVTAILAMTTTVLVPLSEMLYKRRLGIDEAVARATAIVAEYEAAVGGAVGSNTRRARFRRGVTRRRASRKRQLHRA